MGNVGAITLETDDTDPISLTQVGIADPPADQAGAVLYDYLGKTVLAEGEPSRKGPLSLQLVIEEGEASLVSQPLHILIRPIHMEHKSPVEHRLSSWYSGASPEVDTLNADYATVEAPRQVELGKRLLPQEAPLLDPQTVEILEQVVLTAELLGTLTDPLRIQSRLFTASEQFG